MCASVELHGLSFLAKEVHIDVCALFFFLAHFIHMYVVYPQASVYDDTGLYGSGYSSRAVSLNDKNKRSFPVAECRCWLSGLNSISLSPSFLPRHHHHSLLLPTALRIQLVLLWSQLHPQQPRGERLTAVHDHTHAPLLTTALSAGSRSCSSALNYLEILRRKSDIKWSHRKLQSSCAHLPFSAFDSELRWLVRMHMDILATFFFFSGLFKYTVMWAGLTTPAAVTMVTNGN